MSKYTTKFNSKISVAKKDNQEVLEGLSVAGLQDLKSLLPSDLEVGDNPDLLHIVFNLAVVNQANLNFDAITTPTAISIAKNWKMKQLNIEHDRDRIIGVITGAGFSSYPDNKLLTEDEVRGLETPFNIVASAIVWRVAGDIAEILEESSENGICEDISASWELGFDDYVIAVGSEKVNESRIVFDPKEISFLEGFLPWNGGSGYYQEKKLSRVIVGPVIPLGAGLTTSPAADVKGLVLGNREEVYAEEIQASQNKENEQKCENNENKISHEEKPNVNKNTMSINFTSIEQVKAHIEAGTPLDAKDMFNFFLKKLSEAGETYDKLAEEKSTAEASLTEKEVKLSEQLAKLESLEAEFEELKASNAEKEKQQRNTARIDALAEKYDLNPKKIKHLLSQFKDLDDEAYASWLEGTEEFLSSSKKQETVASVSAEDAAIALLEKAKANIDIPNAQGNPENKENKTFGLSKEDIKITIK